MQTMLNVTPGSEVVITIGGETFVHRVGASPRVHVEISERKRESKPEMGAPSLEENPATLGMHAQDIASAGLKTR